MPRRLALAVWATLAGGLVALDVWADRNATPGDTLSECTRELLRTDTPIGRGLFLAGWSALSWWLLPHILRRPEVVVVPVTVRTAVP